MPRRKTKTKRDPLTGISYEETSWDRDFSKSLSYKPKRKSKREQELDNHYAGLVVLFALVIAGIYFLWKWVSTHVWQSIAIGVVLFAIITLIINKKGVRNIPWAKIGSIFKAIATPPKSSDSKGSKRKFPRLSKEKKYAVLEDASNKCEYCAEKYHLHVHHIIGLADGGSNAKNNLVVLCPTCHSAAHGGGISKSRLFNIARKR